MKEFVSAALPLIMVGVALAVLAVNFSKEKQKDEEEKDGKQGGRIAMGVGFGLLFGVALNNCGLWENHVLGLTLGVLWGIALSTLVADDEEALENVEDSEEKEN